MERSINNHIQKDLENKIVLLTGPRQCGKTTLSKQLRADYAYFNYDSVEDRIALKEKNWDRSKPLIIFDELHKMRQWKQWLKGIVDTEGIPPSMIVTGSAKLDSFWKVGDSLAGRYFQYRLHPLDLKEAAAYWEATDDEIFRRLYYCSGYPEPFLKGTEQYYKRWQKTHSDIILKEDLLNLKSGIDIQAIETLVALLKQRVGGSISYSNLARDLERNPNTVKRWLQLLEIYTLFLESRLTAKK